MAGSKEDEGKVITVRLDALFGLTLAALMIVSIAAAWGFWFARAYAKDASYLEKALLECREEKIAVQARLDRDDELFRTARSGGMGPTAGPAAMRKVMEPK